MAFSVDTKDQAYRRAGGRCECERFHSPHWGSRCSATFGRSGAWHAHHKTAASVGGHDGLSNCEVLCLACHEKTDSYGRS